MSKFQYDIRKFNKMYGLPVSDKPALVENTVERLKNFKKILLEEIEEIEEIIESGPTASSLDILTNLADLLGDIQVYCASEMQKFGLPIDDTLEIIMESNFSKLNPDGTATYDDRGKLLKGSNYWKPEPKLKILLERSI